MLLGCSASSAPRPHDDAAASGDSGAPIDAPSGRDAAAFVDGGSVHDGDLVPGDLGRADAVARFDAGLDAPPRPDAVARVDAPPRPDAGPPPPPEVTRALRVLHWNIAGGKEHDCEPALITRAVVRYVRDNQVDLVGLNEVCPSQFSALESALRAQWGLGARVTFAAYVDDRLPGLVGNAIFSRLGLQGVTRERLGSDVYGDRNLLCGQVPSLPHLRFCGTHLSPRDADARPQLERALAQMEGWWRDRRDTVILTGDLNLAPDTGALNAVYAAAASTRNNPDNRGDYRELDDNDPAHCTGYGERSVVTATGGACATGLKIDYIFARANRIVDGDYDGDTWDIPNDCAGPCSDHRAVFGRVRLRVSDP